MIAVGVDAHKHEHAICALDVLGRVIGGRTVSADRQGYAELASWIGRLAEPVVVGIEGAGSYGAGLCEQLLAAGIDVVAVDRPRRGERRRGGNRTAATRCSQPRRCSPTTASRHHVPAARARQ